MSIADALKVNDRRFVPTYAWGENIKGGAITITIEGTRHDQASTT